MSWILDWVPWWVWWVLIGGAAIALAPLWVPIGRGIWAILPNWARIGLVGLVGVLTAYLAGRNRGRRNALEEQRRREAQAIQKRLEVNRRVDRMTPEEANKEDERWVRD